MASRDRPSSLWMACACVLAALMLVSGRTAYDLYALARTRDDLAMSRIWADAVWCNVAIWIALGLPLYGAMNGWRSCRIAVAAFSVALIVVLAMLMRWGSHTLNPWLFAIVALQILGSVLLFVPPSNAFYGAKPA